MTRHDAGRQALRLGASFREYPKAEEYLRASDEDGEENKDDDDPRKPGHFIVRN